MFSLRNQNPLLNTKVCLLQDVCRRIWREQLKKDRAGIDTTNPERLLTWAELPAAIKMEAASSILRAFMTDHTFTLQDIMDKLQRQAQSGMTAIFCRVLSSALKLEIKPNRYKSNTQATSVAHLSSLPDLEDPIAPNLSMYASSRILFLPGITRVALLEPTMQSKSMKPGKRCHRVWPPLHLRAI